MPRKNKRGRHRAVAEVIPAADIKGNEGFKSECAVCAFAGNGGVCATSDGKCLITARKENRRREGDPDGRNRGTG